MKKFDYWKALGDAFKLTLKNYQILFPLSIVLLLGVLLAPLFTKLFSGSLEFGYLFLVIPLLYLMLIAISMIVYGWVFSLIRQVVKKNKIDFSLAFKKGIPLAWKLFKITVILLIFIIVLYLFLAILVMLGALLALIPFLGLILGVIFAVAIATVFFLFLIALLQVIPIIILEEKGAWQSIKDWFDYIVKHKTYTLFMGLIAYLVFGIAYIPMLVLTITYSLSSIASQNYTYFNDPTYLILYFFLSLPLIFVTISVNIFYCLAYLRRKKHNILK